jgi:threonine synthase
MTEFSLRCRACGEVNPDPRAWACEECFGPLGVSYDLEKIDRKTIESRPATLWRYREFLPLKPGTEPVDLGAGCTPLRRAKKLGRALGLKKLYIKDDTVNPTLSFKDRPATVAVSKARELGFDAVGCASTGNLAAATAAHAAKAGIPCYVFVPRTIERGKISQSLAYGANVVEVDGSYDDVNRLVTQIADEVNLAFVNVNIRPYYVEGSKTLAYETLEDLGWHTPDHVLVPTASGALLCAVHRGFKEFEEVGLVAPSSTRVSSAQPEGCSPIVDSLLSSSELSPVATPRTVAHSLAIGSPADGWAATKVVRETGGFGAKASDEEILEAINLLARSEGVLAEPAGGVVIACLKKGAESGEIGPDETVVAYITGNGLKAAEVLGAGLTTTQIGASLGEALSVLGEPNEQEIPASIQHPGSPMRA